MKTRGRNARARGFTLIEILIVIAIIVALGGLVAVGLLGKKKQAKVGLTQADMNTLRQALKAFHMNFDRFPSEEEGLEVLWSKEKLNADADQTKWQKELESPLPNDQWGRPWGYRPQTEHSEDETFDLWSNGADGEEGTADDLTSWAKEDDGSVPADGGGSPSKGG